MSYACPENGCNRKYKTTSKAIQHASTVHGTQVTEESLHQIPKHTPLPESKDAQLKSALEKKLLNAPTLCYVCTHCSCGLGKTYKTTKKLAEHIMQTHFLIVQESDLGPPPQIAIDACTDRLAWDKREQAKKEMKELENKSTREWTMGILTPDSSKPSHIRLCAWDKDNYKLPDPGYTALKKQLETLDLKMQQKQHENTMEDDKSEMKK